MSAEALKMDKHARKEAKSVFGNPIRRSAPDRRTEAAGLSRLRWEQASCPIVPMVSTDAPVLYPGRWLGSRPWPRSTMSSISTIMSAMPRRKAPYRSIAPLVGRLPSARQPSLVASIAKSVGRGGLQQHLVDGEAASAVSGRRVRGVAELGP